MDSPLRVGFIGTGTHTNRGHALYLDQDERVVFTAALDPSEHQLNRFSDQYNISNRFTNEDDFFDSALVDAVVIGSPDAYHFSQLRKSVHNKIHTMVEKPVAANKEELDQLRSLLDDAEQSGVVVTSCHPRRFDKPYMWIKDQLGPLKEKFGDIINIELDFSYHKPTKDGLHTGLLMDHINHELDYVNFALGYSSIKMHKLFDNETRYNAVGQRADGISVMFTGTRMLNNSTFSEFIKIRFARGVVRVNTSTGLAILENHDHDYPKEAFSLSTTKVSGTTDYLGRCTSVNRNFIDTIKGESQSYLTINDLIENTRVGILLTEDGIMHS